MIDETHNVKACYAIGHLYANVLLVRCPHRESYTAVARVWLDDHHDDPRTVWEQRHEFGPFDDPQWMEQTMHFMLLEAMRWQRDHPVL